MISHYFDYKSPYAYLAQEETRALEDLPGVSVEWLPLTLDIPSFLGAAELDESGRDTVQTRNAHQWRRVRYAYMDCRREANRRGLVIRGPQKIFDSSLAHIAFLYARERGDFRPFHEAVYERFWRRELDIEDAAAIEKLLGACGVEACGFADYRIGEGRLERDRIQREAESHGVFGVPSYRVDGELFWGAERLPRVRERIRARSSHGGKDES
ncbi:MAG: DsbA family protein [Proteobacteria bacterium]|nr:DsbA family protein [Pseudomonadota bacterium]